MMAVAMPSWMELHDGEDLLVVVVLLQHPHEDQVEAGLLHHSVHRTWQVNVGGQEHNVLTLIEWCYRVCQDLGTFR